MEVCTTPENITHLYRHFDASGKLLYVGISLNVLGRLHQHRNLSPWFDRIASVTVEKFGTREGAIEAERRAINDENPEYNIALKPVPADDIGYTAKKRIVQAADEITRNVVIQPMYTVPEAAKLLRASQTSVYTLIRSGQLGSVQINSKRLVSGWQLLDYIDSLHK